MFSIISKHQMKEEQGNQNMSLIEMCNTKLNSAQ